MHHIFYSHGLDLFHEGFNNLLVKVPSNFFVIVTLVKQPSDEVESWLDCHAHPQFQDSVESNALLLDLLLLSFEQGIALEVMDIGSDVVPKAVREEVVDQPLLLELLEASPSLEEVEVLKSCQHHIFRENMQILPVHTRL